MPFYRVRAVWNGLDGAPYLSTFNFDASGSSNASEVAECATSFLSGLAIIVGASARYQVQREIQTVNETTGEIIDEEYSDQDVIQGNAGGTAEWSAKQGLLSFRTQQFYNGRGIRGRMFVPGVPTNSGEQVPTQTYLNQLGGTASEFLVNAAAIDAPLVVYSRPREASAGPPPVVARTGGIARISSVTARPYWAVLRSRRQ